MVKHLVSIGLVGGIAAVSACFGDGPTPTAPSDATILITATPGQSCNQGTYIGPVAFGSDHVYASLLPYQPAGGNCNNGGGGGGQVMSPQTVYGYPLGGGSLDRIGSAGVTNDGHVQLVATGSGVAYAFNETANTALLVEPGHFTLPSMSGTQVPFGMFAIGSNVYVGALNSYMTNSGASVIAPNFPNYSGTAITAQNPGEIWQVGSGAIGSWTPNCGALDRCLVANSTSYAYVSVDGGSWSVVQVPLGGTTPVKLGTAPQSGGVAPLGLDIDETHVAWSTSESCVQPMGGGQFNCDMHSCNVFLYDTGTQMTKTLLSTQQFPCVDAKLANGYVYFAIGEISTENNQMIGRGIGRVAIADRTVETLDLGINTPTAGPRRIFPIGDQLYLVDPFVLARIPASALNDKHDFTP